MWYSLHMKCGTDKHSVWSKQVITGHRTCCWLHIVLHTALCHRLHIECDIDYTLGARSIQWTPSVLQTAHCFVSFTAHWVCYGLHTTCEINYALNMLWLHAWYVSDYTLCVVLTAHRVCYWLHTECANDCTFRVVINTHRVWYYCTLRCATDSILCLLLTAQ